jgi:hypothetical protein
MCFDIIAGDGSTSEFQFLELLAVSSLYCVQFFPHNKNFKDRDRREVTGVNVC